MWKLLDRLGRPALAGLFQMHALESNQQGLRLLRDCRLHDASWSRALITSVSAGSTCWYLFRPLLDPERWQRVKHSLRAQVKLLRPPEAGVLVAPEEALRGLAPHALTPRQQRCLSRLVRQMRAKSLAGLGAEQCEGLERHLGDQSRWLGELTRSGTGNDATLRQAMVGVYGRARRSFQESPASGRARRRLSRLAWMEELLVSPSGLILDGRLPHGAAGRLWLGLEEDRWLRRLAASGAEHGLGRKDTVHLARLVARRRKELAERNRELADVAVGRSVEEFAEVLPWLLFRCLSRPGAPL